MQFIFVLHKVNYTNKATEKRMIFLLSIGSKQEVHFRIFSHIGLVNFMYENTAENYYNVEGMTL